MIRETEASIQSLQESNKRNVNMLIACRALNNPINAFQNKINTINIFQVLIS